MEFLIAIGVIVIAITCLGIEMKLRKTNEQNTSEIIKIKEMR